MRKEQDILEFIDSLQLEINKKYDEIYKLQDVERKLFRDVDKTQEEINRLQQQLTR